MITLDDVSELARCLDAAVLNVKIAKAALEEAVEKQRLLSEETIPAVMQELGVKDLTLENGKKMSLKQDVYSQIPNDKKPLCYAWLNEKGFGGLIKTTVSVEFGKGEREDALELVNKLNASGLNNIGFQEGVHVQTMKSFLKEQIKKGNPDLDLELFGAKVVNIATIK